MGHETDPFYQGMPSQVRDAQWFEKLWVQMGYQGKTGIHLRRMHYRIDAQRDPVPLPRIIKEKGEVFEHYTLSNGCWFFLVDAGRAARYLGEVPFDAFVDRRNPDAEIHDFAGPTKAEFTWGVGEDEFDAHFSGFRGGSLPSFGSFNDLPNLLSWRESMDRIYLLEIWAEKSTQNDILVPICREHKVNLVTGLGELSITQVNELVANRIAAADRPTRIFYISDFDPKGILSMPQAVGRKIEWMLRNQEIALNVKMCPLILTPTQAETYDLPRNPIKKSENLKKRFEELYGEGAVELDALEALYPGELARIVNDALRPYSQASIEDWIDERYSDFESDIKDAEEIVLGSFQEEIYDLGERRKEIAENLQPLINELEEKRREIMEQVGEHSEEIEQLSEDWRELYGYVSEAMENVSISDGHANEIAEAIEGVSVEEEDENWLFDSSRSYQDQLEIWKRHKRGEFLESENIE